MKLSKSNRNLHLVTELAAQTETLRASARSRSKTPGTCKKTPKQIKLGQHPLTCKNQYSSTPLSSQQPTSNIKSRSNSNTTQEPLPAENINNEYRRQELDGLCLQKIVTNLKKFLQEQEYRWELHRLNYHQLIKILYRLGYVAHN